MPRSEAKPARVLVLDGHSSAGLAFVRSLGRAGHWVAVGTASGIFGWAGLSRYCRVRFEYPAPTKGAAEFISAVERFVCANGIELIAPMTDATIEPLLEGQERFQGRARLAAGPAAPAKLVCDKFRTIRLAREAGVPTPDTVLLSTLSDLDQVNGWPFPVVVKDRFSIRWAGGQGTSGSTAYSYSREELRRKVEERLSKVGDVILQRFTPGVGIGYSAFIANGEVRIPFMWERIREKDPRGSGSSARKSIPLDSHLCELSENLLKQAGFEGIAMVEYKRDPGTGRPALMEINGRPWGSLQLPIHCGIDYPRYLLEWLLADTLPPKSIAYKVGINCRWLAADLSHLENVWHGKPEGWPQSYPNFWTTLLKVAVPWYPGLRYDDLSWRDPLPGIAQVAGWFWTHLGR